MEHKKSIVTSFDNMRNLKFKQLREQLKSTSRFGIWSRICMLQESQPAFRGVLGTGYTYSEFLVSLQLSEFPVAGWVLSLSLAYNCWSLVPELLFAGYVIPNEMAPGYLTTECKRAVFDLPQCYCHGWYTFELNSPASGSWNEAGWWS
ncbi:hypothetical protein Hanom_Chr11g00996351 [Helianthus anomalus]